MKKHILLTAISALIFTSPAFAAETICDSFAKTMTRHIVEVFHDKSQSEAQKRTELASVFQKAVDTDWIGRFVLGRFWKTATPAEQAEYLKNYRSYITHNYISKFNDEDGMSVDDITLASLIPQGTGQYEAQTLIKRKNEADVKVDYTLDDTSGKCQVHDIRVEGISLLISQRSEFSALAGNSGVKGVIEALQKKQAATHGD